LAIAVYDLAVEVVLYLVAFQRRVEDGEEVSYDDTRAEALGLLNDLDQRSHTEPGLWDAWTKARVPLVYLIDEVMILNCPWPHRQQWADNCLEVALLGHPEALGGENFYTECDEALREMEVAERHERHDTRAMTEIVMVFYVALQTGFKGRYALDLDAWREYKGHVFSKLPAYAQTRTKELFPEADDHTVLLDPNYEPVTRLLYVFIGFLLMIVLYLGATWSYWSEMVDNLSDYARDASVPTSQAVASE
jgi:type IV/VI secretion system ImpK/VasF family protein